MPGTPTIDHPLVQQLRDTTARVDIWRADIGAFEPLLPALILLLSEDERQRASRFHFRPDYLRAVVARANLRVLLGHMTSTEPQALAITGNAHAKPYLSRRPGAC